NHQPEAQHPKSSAIHKPPANYPIYGSLAEMAILNLGARFTPESRHGLALMRCRLRADKRHRTLGLI
ncbi:MAG: hypothetical protein WB774_10650, partial [Xanthobacteraceae bacterium]